MNKTKSLHLLWRSGFGPNLSQIKELDSLSPFQMWAKIKKSASLKLAPILPQTSYVQDNYNKLTDTSLSPEQRAAWNRQYRSQSNQDLKDMNNLWLQAMAQNENQLGEKMALFWHDHFAIRHANSYLQHKALNIIREHALGDFKIMLREMSKTGAMILSLNNQQNRKASPNENFARELFELFTLGVGNYTEQDIKEAARAFTGWTVDADGKFIFRTNRHDLENKTIFGKIGKFDGDDVIDILLEHEGTSTFIAGKIYGYFVNEKLNDVHIKQLAKIFKKEYNIMHVMEALFTSNWFYAAENIGNKIKSPVELLVGLRRLSPFASFDRKLQESMQRLLGQILFYPPSIAGWPKGKEWIDNSTLMVRLQLPQVAYGNLEIRLKAKNNDDVDMGKINLNEFTLKSNVQATPQIQWEDWVKSRTPMQLNSDLIIPAISGPVQHLLEEKTKGQSPTQYALSLMGLPEYQLY